MTPRGEPPRRLEGVPNFRDLGGLPTEDGRLTRRGILYRSSGLEELTPRDVRHLIDDIGLSTVIDLRSPDDCEPAIPLQGTRVRVINLPIIRAGLSTDLERPMGPDGRVDVALIYRMFMEMSIPAITEIVRELTSGATPALLHCSAGKDRTRVVAAMILRPVGVPAEAAIADLMETKPVLTEITAYLLRRPAHAQQHRRDAHPRALLRGRWCRHRDRPLHRRGRRRARLHRGEVFRWNRCGRQQRGCRLVVQRHEAREHEPDRVHQSRGLEQGSWHQSWLGLSHITGGDPGDA